MRKSASILTFLPLLWLSYSPSWANEPATEPAQLTLEDLRTFADVFEQIRRNFIEEIDDATLLQAAIHGMVNETDAYSAFMSSEAFRALDDSSRGRMAGIGAEIMIQHQRLVVQAVSEGGPAANAGVLPGDLILAVDGQPVRGRKLAKSIEALQGEPGSEVVIRLRSVGQDARELSVTRDWVNVISVSGEWLSRGIAYLQISHFHEDSHLEFQQLLQEMQSEGSPALRGLLLDLRQNLGGHLEAAVAIADGFLDQGLIVYTRSRYPATQLEFKAHPGQWVPDVPVAILVDEATASASEVLAGALQDHRRAHIIGHQTYGKGSIQSILRLRNGSALRLTTARYYTPSGASLQEQGIMPDLITNDGDDPRRQALKWLRKAATGDS